MLALVLALVVATAASAWLIARSNQGSSDEPYRLYGDYEVYPSIESLAEAADLVVEATVGPVVLREVDRGGDPEVDPATGEKIPGIPMVFSEITIVDVLKASPAIEAQANQTILVATVDTELLAADQESPLQDGEHVVLFLRHRDPSTAPGLTPDSFYVPVSGDNGVFDLEDSVATPRLGAVRGLHGDTVEAGPTPERAGSFDLAAIDRVVRAIVP